MNPETAHENPQGSAARPPLDGLGDWLPENHAAVRATLAALKAECTQARQRLTDKPTFERLNALVTATTAALWVLDRTPADLQRGPLRDAVTLNAAPRPLSPADQTVRPGPTLP